MKAFKQVEDELIKRNAENKDLVDALLYLLREAIANGMVTSEPAIVQAKTILRNQGAIR